MSPPPAFARTVKPVTLLLLARARRLNVLPATPVSLAHPLQEACASLARQALTLRVANVFLVSRAPSPRAMCRLAPLVQLVLTATARSLVAFSARTAHLAPRALLAPRQTAPDALLAPIPVPRPLVCVLPVKMAMLLLRPRTAALALLAPRQSSTRPLPPVVSIFTWTKEVRCHSTFRPATEISMTTCT